MDAVEVIRKLYRDHGAGNIDGMISHLSDDVTYDWPVDPQFKGLSGKVTGKQAFRERVETLRSSFHYNSFEITSIFGHASKVADETDMDLTYVSNTQRLRFRAAHFWTLKDGKITQLVEYFDSALLVSVAAVPVKAGSAGGVAKPFSLTLP